MHVVLGDTGAAAVRVRESLVLDPSLDFVTAYAAIRVLFPDTAGEDIIATLEAVF